MDFKNIFCSKRCEKKLNRSFKKCPKCKNIWVSQTDETLKYYCNTAWVMCESCAKDSKSCVSCGKNV